MRAQPVSSGRLLRETVRRGQLLAYLGCSFAIGVFSGFNSFTLTLWLAGFTSSYILLGLLGNTRSFEGSLVSPAAGFWSDRVWAGWLGRRRPFILVGGLLSALLLALTPAFARIPFRMTRSWLPHSAPELLPAVIIIFAFTLLFNAMGDIHEALLVDLTTEAERNRVSAIRTVVSIGGQVAILLLGFLIWTDHVPDSAFVVAGAIMAAGILLTVVFVHEPTPAAWATSRAAGGKEERLPLWAAARRYRSAAIFCAVAFCYWSGVNAVLPLISIYIRNILHATIGESQVLPALLMASTVLFAFPMAKLGDWFGKRRVMGAGFAIMACIGVAGLVITTKQEGAIVLTIAGIGNAASQVLTVPLLADLVPHRHIGAATGILAGSGSIAAPVASLIAGGFANVYGPRIIFLLMSVAVTCALLLLLFVHPPPAEAGEAPAAQAGAARTGRHQPRARQGA